MLVEINHRMSSETPGEDDRMVQCQGAISIHIESFAIRDKTGTERRNVGCRYVMVRDSQ